MTRVLAESPTLTVALIAGAMPGTRLAQGATSSDDLIGAWRGAMQSSWSRAVVGRRVGRGRHCTLGVTRL